MSLNPLYIIPARGGSKGIPGKNIKLLAGKPLIAYTIEAAIAAGATPGRIILSTDSDSIAAVAAALGLPVPYRRPEALGSDTTGSREVILDVMDWADSQGIAYDCVVLLQPTSPLRTPSDIAECMARFIPGETDMAVTVTEAAANPYYDCFETDDRGLLHVSRRHHPPPGRPAGLADERRRICNRPRGTAPPPAGGTPPPRALANAALTLD